MKKNKGNDDNKDNKDNKDTECQDMVGLYAIARCYNAGVHAGYVKSINGQTCVLSKSRRLWYWKPSDGQSYLSGVASHGLDKTSQVGNEIEMTVLTEVCEIMQCTSQSTASIKGIKSHEQ